MRERRCREGEWEGEGVYTECVYKDNLSGEMHQLINVIFLTLIVLLV